MSEWRPGDHYADLLIKHMGGVRPFNGHVVLPRAVEFHLSNDTGKGCNLNCVHCQGQRMRSARVNVDQAIIEFIKALNGLIPLFIISGNFTEPTLNKNLLFILETIKQFRGHFGLHTNGTLLYDLETNEKFLTKIYKISDPADYISIAIDAGTPSTFARTKGIKRSIGFHYWKRFMLALRELQKLREVSPGDRQRHLRVHITYLLNRMNSSEAELQNFTAAMQIMGVDTLRFSVPYPPFGTSIEDCLEYQQRYADPFYARVAPRLKRLLSTDPAEKTRVFALSPETQDVGHLTFHRCYHPYFMLAVGADGYFYPCSAVAGKRFEFLRLGEMVDNIDAFQRLVIDIQGLEFDPQQICFPHGARCTRAGMEINEAFDKMYGERD
jgi:organic radical activating enzyme